MITYQKASRDQIDTISAFIAELNQDRTEQTGWLGTNLEEIADQLRTLPYVPFENSHILAYENENLVGVFGFYAFPEKGLIRLIGPHVRHTSWRDVTQALWNEVQTLIPDTITTVKGFTDSANQKCLDFFHDIGLQQYNAETVMSLHRDDYVPVEIPTAAGVSVQPYQPDLLEGFKALHPAETFFTAEEILNQLSETKQLWLLTENGSVQGYTYVELLPESGVADIVFLQVAEASRNKKYGSLLIATFLQAAFAHSAVTEVQLSVRPENPAIRLYLRLGFKELNTIVAFEKEL